MPQETSSSTERDPAADQQTWVDRERWHQLAAAADGEEYFSAWLDLQCRQLPACRTGLLLAETRAEKTFAPTAIWPQAEGVSEALLDVARSALDEGEAIVVDLFREYATQYSVEQDSVALAYPLKLGDQVLCVAAIELGNKKQQNLEVAMRQLQWGASWLESYFLRDQSEDDEATIDRLVTALYMTATASKESSANQAVSSFVTELATRLKCERVSCGFKKGRHVKVSAVSHSGQFGKQMNLVNAIGKAMDEALAQNTTINFPEPDGNGVITHSHAQLAGMQNGGAVMSLPLVAEGRNIGALCLERNVSEAFDDATVQLCDSIVTVVAPIFQEKRLNDRWILTKLKDSFLTQLGRLIGPRYIGRKLFVLGLLAVCGTLLVARGEFRVTADAVLEGSEQRAVVTPYDGFVENSIRRVGDNVSQGELIATLDDTELRLDLVELTSERAQAQSQYDEAVAEHSRAKAKIFDAKVAQADARIELVRDKLSRTQLSSPIDGIIVKGDLSQSLGAAVSRGELLFEIASLDEYRVNLQVDERDISYVQPGQGVQIVLSAFPDEIIDVLVDNITPLTRAAEGRNYFNVEARLMDETGVLRPGMEGVAKISISEQSYVWIGTRELINWLQLWFWRWTN